MGNISIKLNLTQFHSVIKPMPTQSGKVVDCVVLPIEKNHFFKGEKGVYVDLIAFELKNKKEGIKDTHSLKQSFSKEYLEALSQDEKNALPFLGGLVVWDENSSSEKAPIVQDEKSDLPWD
jgi:hypothetical protein